MTHAEPRFEILRTLGSGATARVELARLLAPFGDLPEGAQVAVKSLAEGREAEPWASEAFRVEAEVGRFVRHTSLMRVLHRGEREGRPYLVLQYLPGRTLREALHAGPLPEPLVRHVGIQIAGALAALHTAGVAHGDVKPENVRLDDRGRAVLIDLGFATRFERPAHGAGATGTRVAGGEMGSLAYLSPERVEGAAPAGASDVFALGVMLYELATGLHPFGFSEGPVPPLEPEVLALSSGTGELLRRMLETPDADRLLAAIARARVLVPSQLVATLSPFLDDLLPQLLARRPEERPTAAELERRLDEGEAGAWWRARQNPRERVPERSAARRLGGQLLPMVGRERELARLDEAFDAVRAGETRVVWIRCPEGGGKWRFGQEFAARARSGEDPPIFLYARWTPSVEARTAGALSILLLRWLRLPMRGEPGPQEERVLEDLVGRRRTETLLSAVVSETSERYRGHSDSVPEALAEWLAAIARERPLIVFLDDLHRAGTVTLESLSALLDALHGRVMLLLGEREEVEVVDPLLVRLRARLERLADPGQERPGLRALSISLPALSRAAVRTLVDEVFVSSVPRDRLAEVLYKRSHGNPGLLNEILHDLLADGRAVRAERKRGEPARLDLHIAPDDLPRPRSLDRIVAERLEALAPEERDWLERLSVVGGRLDATFLERAFPPTPRAEIDELLARLVRRGWLVPVANRYRFARPALREGIYRSLDRDRRRQLHHGAAQGLVPGTDEAPPTAEQAFQRAFHLKAAGEPRELYPVVRDLIDAQRRRASTRRLLTLARWGLEAITAVEHELDPAELTRSRLELFELAADAADRLGRRVEERELLDSLTDLDIDYERHPEHGARLYLLHARYAVGTGMLGIARGYARNAVELARASGDSSLTSEALRRLAQVQGQIGELESGTDLAREALVAASTPTQRALSHLTLGHLEVLRDRLEDALRDVDRGLAILESEAGDEATPTALGVEAYAHLLRARVWRSLGRRARAYAAARRAVELARRRGERRLEGEARARMGGLLLDLDRPAEAEAQLRDAELLADEIEDRRGQVLARMFLGVLLHEEEDPGAGAMLERATTLAHEIAFHRAESYGLAIQARWARGRGDLASADALSARARTLLDHHGAELTDRIVILGTRVSILRSLGKNGRAAVLERRLERRLARAHGRIADPTMAADLAAYGESLMAAVISPEGPVLPRRPQ